MLPPDPTGRDEWGSPAHAAGFIRRRSRLGRASDGDEVMDEIVPEDVRRVLDLGTGGGHLIAVLRLRRPAAEFVGVDISPTMLAAARTRFADDPRVVIREHDLSAPLPAVGRFDAVVSAFAIHHLEHPRKRTLLEEIFRCLASGGLFANLEHVSSPTARLHEQFLTAIGNAPHKEDASNRCIDVESQLAWMRNTGLVDVDCAWKWREMAVLTGVRP
jgi:SAM-dependent methyltransferase